MKSINWGKTERIWWYIKINYIVHWNNYAFRFYEINAHFIYHFIYVNNNQELSKFVLYFHPDSIHAHIILWINYVVVDHITNEIAIMVLATIDEQFGKLLDNKHDLILFKPMEWKQKRQFHSWCKTNKHIKICEYEFPIIIFVKQHVAQHPITQKWVKKTSSRLCDFWIQNWLIIIIFIFVQSTIINIKRNPNFSFAKLFSFWTFDCSNSKNFKTFWKREL